MRLTGAYHLESFVITYADGRSPLYPLGQQATGMLHYSDSGHMCALLTRGERPLLGASRLETADRAADPLLAAAMRNTVSYAGTYSVDGSRVHHQVTHSLIPDMVGQSWSRTIEVTESGMVLRYHITPASGITRHYALTWRRA